MPPKKSKTRGRRKASDASTISEAPSTQSQSQQGKRTKRTLRSTTTVEEEHQILDEVQEVIEEDEDELVLDSQQPNKHVHFGSSAASDELLDNTTATHITPHPRKMASKRRMTDSPTENTVGDERPSKRFKRVSVRYSLPASLSQEESGRVLEEHSELVPLSEVLTKRVQHRARIHELRNQLEQQKKFNAKSKIEQIENELANLQEEDIDTGYDNLSEEMLVLARQQQVWKSESFKELMTVNGKVNEQQSLSQSQTRSYEDVQDLERKRFQDAILSLSHEANEAKTKLQVLEIELEGLGFAGEDSHTILTNIREKFTWIRENLHGVLHPNPEDLSNLEMLDVVVSNVTDFADRLKAQHKQLEDQDKFAAELGRQIHGLIEHLADRDLRITQLQEQWTELDQKSDEKAREIEELQEELQDVVNQRDALDEELEAKTKEAESLAEENGDHATNLERLKTSLKDYQDEETRLTQLIAKMEDEHKNSVEMMNREREQTVRELEDRLDAEMQTRGKAEQLSIERQSMITSLELQLERKDEEMEALGDEIDELNTQRQAAEAEVQEKDFQVGDLETRVDRLDEELSALRVELEELRSLNEDERAQHDATRDEVEQLNTKLLEDGQRANELRQKLFEVQQANEKKVKDLEVLASDRDEQYQSDIAREVERREASEELAQQRAATILEADTRIQELEKAVAEGDQRLDQLEDEVAVKEDAIDTLQNDLESAERRHSAQVAQYLKEREQLNASIEALSATLAEREDQITQLRDEDMVTTDLHNGEIEDRNAKIAELNHTVADLQEQVAELEAEKLGLEGRVDSEAQQMLQLQNEKEDEIEDLKEMIRDKQAKILTVEEKAVEADQRWQEVLGARDAEIAMLHATEEETTETVTSLTTNLNELRTRFKKYVLEKSAEIKKLKAQVNASADKMVEDDEDALEHLRVFGDSVSTTVSNTQVQTKKTQGRKKRVMDSGIGLENGDETIAL